MPGDPEWPRRTVRDIWLQHETMLAAVIAGDGDRAEELARKHIIQAAAVVIERLEAERQARPAAPNGAIGLVIAPNGGTPNSTLHADERTA